MSIKRTIFLILLACIIVTACSGLEIYTRNADRIEKEDLRANLNNPDFVIIDVRIDSSWNKSEFKMKGAVREDFYDVESWSDKYDKESTIVLYCA